MVGFNSDLHFCRSYKLMKPKTKLTKKINKIKQRKKNKRQKQRKKVKS